MKVVVATAAVVVVKAEAAKGVTEKVVMATAAVVAASVVATAVVKAVVETMEALHHLQCGATI